MHFMKFSVVVPLYNKAPYIEFTLNSVLNQSFSDYEVIVVDDGSSDGGAELVQRIAMSDARVRLVRQMNGGVSSARNTGITAAIGEWIAFLDADDWWHPDYLVTQAAAIAAMPDVEMAATLLRNMPDSNPWCPLPWPALPLTTTLVRIDDLPTRWMQGTPFFTSSIVIKRECLQRLSPCFVVGESYGEDLDLWFRVAEVSDIAHTLVPLVAYRTEAVGSLSKINGQITLPPYLHRMQVRAVNPVTLPAKRSSALAFVAQQKLTLARTALAVGKRRQGLAWLLAANHIAGSKRWLMTAFMLFMPAASIALWEKWRISRTTQI